MQPVLSEAVAAEHRRDLMRRAENHRRVVDARHARPSSTHGSWDASLGWMLIRIGCRLVALRATPAQAGTIPTL